MNPATSSSTMETVAAPLGSAGRAAEATGTSALVLGAGGVLALGPFLLAAVALRAIRPEIFGWGSAQLDLRSALVSAVMVAAAGLTAIVAGLLARMGWKWAARGLLLLTLVQGALFLGLRYHESMGLLERGLAWGGGFKPVAAETTGESPVMKGNAEGTASADALAPVDPDATTVPPPAPPPAGLAPVAEESAAPVPPGGALFFGLFHLMSLLAAVLVLGAVAGSVRAFSAAGRASDDPRGGAVLAGALLPWQLAAVSWLFTLPLLYIGGGLEGAAAVVVAGGLSVVLLAGPAAVSPGRPLGVLALGAGVVILLSLAGYLSMDASASRPEVKRYRRPPLIEPAEEEVAVQPAAPEAAEATPAAGSTPAGAPGAAAAVGTPPAVPAS